MNRKYLTLILLFIILITIYFFPVPSIPFGQLYAKVDAKQTASLQNFRQTYPPKQIEVKGVKWEYVSLGAGKETILFLHGMTGAHDIW